MAMLWHVPSSNFVFISNHSLWAIISNKCQKFTPCSHVMAVLTLYMKHPLFKRQVYTNLQNHRDCVAVRLEPPLTSLEPTFSYFFTCVASPSHSAVSTHCPSLRAFYPFPLHHVCQPCLDMSAVTLRIYDLSQGMARQLSPAILGKQIDAIWHTSVQVFDREYYFGGGICADPPGMTPYGTPHSVEHMGHTEKTTRQFLDFLSQNSSSFSMQAYHLLDNNCNNFSDAVCIFLLNKHIPQHILDLPSEALNSPLGPLIRPMIDQMQAAVTSQSMGHQVQLPASSNPSPPRNLSTSSNLPTSPAYWNTPITLSKANRQAIQSKLHQQHSQTFTPETPPTCHQLLQYALTTPDLQHAFPALDYLRLLALEQSQADQIVSDISKVANRFALADDTPPIPCMMALRIFVNLFKHASTTVLMCKNPPADDLVESACTALERDHPALRKTAALLLLNFSGASRRHPGAAPLTEDHIVRMAYAAVARLNHDQTPKPEEATPLLQTIFILAEASPDTKSLLSAFELSLDQYQDSTSCIDRDTHEVAVRVAKLLS